MKKKIRFIINPISGTGKQAKAEKAINKFIDSSLIDFEILYSRQQGHFSFLAKDAVEKSFDAVVVVGGDGSINEALEGLIGSRTALGIIPIGSGNGLARHLHIPMSLERAIRRINKFETKLIDTAVVNNRAFVIISGLGFDAQVAAQFSFTKKRGLWNYTIISIREYFRYTNQKYHLILDEKTIVTEAFMIVFANANQFGNNLIISPQGRIDDGLLDVCIVQKPKLYQIPNLFIKVFKKKVDQSKLIKIHRAKKIKLEFNNQVLVNIDGEAVLLDGSLNINVNPLSLLVIS